jgi:hypothetical protein
MRAFFSVFLFAIGYVKTFFLKLHFHDASPRLKACLYDTLSFYCILKRRLIISMNIAQLIRMTSYYIYGEIWV